MELQSEQLAVIVQQMAETVIAASETIEQLIDGVNHLTVQSQEHDNRIDALTEAMQTLSQNQSVLIVQVAHLNETLDRIATSSNSSDA